MPTFISNSIFNENRPVFYVKNRTLTKELVLLNPNSKIFLTIPCPVHRLLTNKTLPQQLRKRFVCFLKPLKDKVF